MKQRAQIIGTGLIGGSIGLALREAGWHVSGCDRSDAEQEAAQALPHVEVESVICPFTAAELITFKENVASLTLADTCFVAMQIRIRSARLRRT